MKKVRIIVAGGRDFADYNLLFNSLMDVLTDLEETNTVENKSQIEFISGTCRGADVLGEQFAYNFEYSVKRFPAKWDELGKRAGYVRNCDMAKYASGADIGILVAFWDGISKGTRNMIDIAKRYGLGVKVVKY